MTKEMLAKKAIKTQKRREQAQEKREEDKVRFLSTDSLVSEVRQYG